MPRLSDAEVYQQPTELPLKISKETCGGKIYIVTGANVGLGMEASRHLVAVGASKVIMAVRNMQAGEAAKADIESTTGVSNVAEVWELDLSKYSSVRAFCAKAIKELGRIEAVIENAAVASSKAGKMEGHVPPLTVNVFSTFLIAALLLPKLRVDAKTYGYTPRIAIVTSNASFDMEGPWKKIADDPIHKVDNDESLGLAVYPLSKLMEIMAVRHLAKVLPLSKGGVIITGVNPGVCMTTLARDAPQSFKDELAKLWKKSGRTPECGSRTLLAGAVAPEDCHGAYMSDCEQTNSRVPMWVDDAAGQQAWSKISEELNKIEPGVVDKAFD